MKRFAALPLLTALLASCGGGSPPPDTAPPPGVSVSLAQWRSDEPAHILQVAVRNAGPAPVHFSHVQLVTPSFATLPPAGEGATVGRTERTDLPIPFGRARCASGGLPGVQSATVVARVRVGDEPEPRRVVFHIPHPDPLLTRLLREECSEQLIRQAADLAFGPEWTRAGDTMRGTLVLTRRGGGTVTVHSIDGTSHYTAAPVAGGDPIAVLDAAAGSARAAIRLTPGRCDPHAFAEAKKAFQFPVRASVDGGERRVVIVTPPAGVRERLIRYALEVCGLPVP